jgi:hypothetical protein
MLSQDAQAFETLMQDLCLAFNRPYTPELTRVFWESLKHVHIAEVRRNADAARKTLKKFPTPKDLTPDRVMAPPQKPVDTGPQMSSWAIAANQILFSVAYQGHRGFQPIAKWETTPERGWGLPLKKPDLVDGSRLEKCLARKAEYVQMAEEAARGGDVWEPQEFNRMCREGFEALLA